MYQKLIIAGNLGRDVELRTLQDGTQVANFSVATNRSYTRNDEKIKETVWFRVSAWRRLAEVCAQYLHKGSGVLVEGRLNPDRQTGGPKIWTGQDGTPRAGYDIVALNVTFLGGGGQQQNNDDPGVTEGVPPEEVGEDIPF